ncbi:MAG: hypothetical protein E7363_03080 [Clostridiales bacterium]|nr:hypothetical protein [Clostridiales bacterium]
MKRYRQSIYPVISRAVQALICGFAVYVAISAMFYGNLLMVCSGELFAATAFAISLSALVFSIGMIDDLRRDVYTHAESVAFSAHGRVPALSSFIPRGNILRVSYSAGLIKRLLKTRKLVIITEKSREVLYIKEKDFPAVCTCLPESFAKSVMRLEKKERQTKTGASFAFSYMEGLRTAVKVLVYELVLLCTVYPAVIGIFVGNKVTLKGVLPQLSLGGTLAVIFAIAVGIALAVALVSGGAKMLIEALPYANYHLNREGNILTVSRGRMIKRVYALRLDLLRAVRRSQFPLLGLRNQSLTLYFAEGKRKFSLSVAGRSLSPEEREKVMQLLPDYTEGELKRLPLKQFFPTALAFITYAFLPTTLFAALESWIILCLCVPFGIAFLRLTQVRAVGENEKAISYQKGLLGESCITVLKKNISCVKTAAGLFARPFRVATVQIYLKQTEFALEIPCLSREEGEKALFLAKHAKK